MTVSTKFYEIFAPLEGIEVHNIIGGARPASGYIRQIFISCIVGGGSFLDLQIRYLPNDTSITNLICLISRAELPEFAGFDINAPFDVKSRHVLNDLILYLKPEADGVFKIRIDFEFDGV